jgi:hypothetical protein
MYTWAALEADEDPLDGRHVSNGFQTSDDAGESEFYNGEVSMNRVLLPCFVPGALYDQRRAASTWALYGV